ncbi:MAG: hypothetical protein U9R15_00085 [Chloroflexota bacterium]|nr:hypothetical protein [Chloroflexota bacterium]
MKVKICSMSVIVVTVLAMLLSTSVGAQSPNTYASIIMTDILSGAPVVGGTFTTDLQVAIENNAPPEVGVMGVEIWIPFDANKVAVNDFDDNPANGIQVEIKNDFFDGSIVVGANEVIIGAMPATAPPACTATCACIHIAVSHTGGSGPVTNATGVVATITWAGLATGPSGISVAPGSVLADSDGQPIPINSISVPNISIIDAGDIEGVVERQGAQDHTGTVVVAIAVGDGVIAEDTTDADGNFSLAVPMGSTYTVNASYLGYLQSQKGSVYVVGASVDIDATVLVGGDVNGDSCINILDVVSIIGKFGQSGFPASDPTDINDDGTIDIFDLTIAAGNFGRCGTTSWGSNNCP